MSIFQELDYNPNIDKVVNVQFSVLSPEEIRRRSVAEIYTQETYDGDIPKIGGLFDPRMGVLDHGKFCPTDNLDNRNCPGYFGHIELAMPVFHIHFLKYTIDCLKCVCWKCSKLLIDSNSPEIRKIINKKKGNNLFKNILSLCSKVKRCGEKNEDGCGSPKPASIRKDTNGIGKLIVEWRLKGGDEKTRIMWDASDVHKILRRISDLDIQSMGFNKYFCKPEWLICSVFGVCPPSVRPSVRSDNNTRMEDDLTHKLCDIIKTNRTLKNKLLQKSPKKVIDEWYQLLQYHIATLVDNTLPGIPPAQQRSGRALKSIKERLKSKEGRVRGNLMGKRVDYSARSVITPDPNISINELGVPIEIAKNLTYPEIVTKYNIENLTKIVQNGYDKYPGAKSIKRISDKKIVSLKVLNSSNYQLDIGDIVNRNLIDGDYVLFNRQPSLHRMSMMCHRVKVLPYKTFRLNVSVTTPYNADFDGDEMNMHVPQSIQTSIELKHLASVETQIISPSQHSPIIALVQDSIIGSYLLTRYDNYLTRDEILDLLYWIPDFDGNIPSPDIIANTSYDLLPEWFPRHKYDNTQDLWSGRSIFSLIIPKINMEKKNQSYDYQSNFMNKVIIKDGNIIDGVFDKQILGTKEQGIVHIVFNEYGPERTKKFLDDAQNLITNWMLMSGFSIGLGDLMPDQESTNKMIETINDKKQAVIEVIEHVHKGILKNDTGNSNSEEFEIQVMQNLNQATGSSGKIAAQYLDSNNRMKNIVNSGSKGSELNIGQMIACVGQQSVDGKRIPYGFTDRTLPHFHKYDDGSAARGFVSNSFVKGLTPTEFFFHAMGGREGLIDTAVKTSETGYIQRKLVKGMEDVRIEVDYSVRDANKNIIQFLYGEDGMDPTKIERQFINTLTMNKDNLFKKYKLHFNDWEEHLEHNTLESFLDNENMEYKQKLFDEYFDQILIDKKLYIEQINGGNLVNGGEVHYPINIQRLIKNALVLVNGNKSDLNPIYILEKIKELNNKLVIADTFSDNKLLIILLRCYLCPNDIIKNNKLNKTAFDYIIGNIMQQFINSLAQPGDLVGVISAQSIGEPSTQMTLNTFHFAGVSSKSQVTRGLSRFKELLSATKNMKSPYLTVYLDDEHAYNKEKASNIINEITITHIKQLIKSSEIYYESNNSTNQLDNDLLKIYSEFEEFEPISSNISKNPWILRLEMDKRKMMDKNIKMIDIYYAIIDKFSNHNDNSSEDISCIFSDDNASSLIFRIRCMNKLVEEIDDCPEEDTICILKTLEKTILNDITLSGLDGITNASMSKYDTLYKYNPENNEFEHRPEWVLDTTGSNLLEIFKHPAVNSAKTLSNDIHEIYHVLGIEAARQVLIDEISQIFSDSGGYVNSRHITLLADVMTNKGGFMSIDRHGINKSDRGPLAKCSFEETPDIIAKAAIFGELDKVSGVSSNIMLGQEVPIGTGSIEIIFDEDKFNEIYGTMENIIEDSVSQDSSITKKNEFLNTVCSSNTFTDNLFDKI
jgi:DNA-directed RNA polymerase II subunit RPB1